MKSTTLTLLTLSAILMATGLSSTGADRRQKSGADAAKLRARFLSAVGNDLDLVTDEFRTGSGEQASIRHWLAHAKPKVAGHFALHYSFKPQNRHYSHVEHETFFSVGPKGCHRGRTSPRSYGRFCLGDTVIIPVVVETPADVEFKLTRTPLAPDEDWKTFDKKYPEARDQGLDKTPVANPSEHLRYVGRRAPTVQALAIGYMVELEAEFEAVKPGKFKLGLGVSSFDQTSTSVSMTPVPIIVVDREQSLTLIAARETVRGFTAGDDGREWVSSTSSNTYMTSLIVLQPGDRISLPYLRVRRGDRYARLGASDPAAAIGPVITVHPFSFDAKYDFFGSWVVKYLP